jgi:hypothetical protein
MRKIKLIALAGIIVLGSAACRKGLHNAGPIITETRSVTVFDKLVVEGDMEIVVTTDSTFAIVIEAGERLMRYVNTEVQGNTLVVSEENNRLINKRTVKVYISVAALEKIELSGSGSVTGDLLHTPTFTADLEGSGSIDVEVDAIDIIAELRGSGEIEMTGWATNIEIECIGSGEVTSRFTETATAVAYLDGSGDINVFASDELTATIFGSGDIYYWGNPADVDYSLDGSGELVEMQ